MDLSKKWLLDYIDLNVGDKTFSDEMTLSGSKVEGYEKEGSDSDQYRGRQTAVARKAPGFRPPLDLPGRRGAGEPLQIVTGAQNLKEGDFVPVALDHSTVHGGKQIKRASCVACRATACSARWASWG